MQIYRLKGSGSSRFTVTALLQAEARGTRTAAAKCTDLTSNALKIDMICYVGALMTIHCEEF